MSQSFRKLLRRTGLVVLCALTGTGYAIALRQPLLKLARHRRSAEDRAWEQTGQHGYVRPLSL